MNVNSQYQNSQSTADDIIKMGYLKKGKKGKKRFFVLRQDSYNAPARLDCYHSDKRFRQGVQPKLSIKLKDVFNINKTVVDSKLKHCVGVFARDETLILACDTVEDQDAWLYTLLNVYNSAKSGTPEEHSRQNFDNVWDIVITRVTDRKCAQLRGPHRFCLTPCSIYLYKKSSDDVCCEFPLVYIANYGHKNDMLFLRVGRSAVTGQCELWMQTDEPAIAHNIHETMKRILEENHEHRQRNCYDSMKQNLRGCLSHVKGAYSSSGSSTDRLSHSGGSFSGGKSNHSTTMTHRSFHSPVSSFSGPSTVSSRRCSLDSSIVPSTSGEKQENCKPSHRQFTERTVSLEYVTNNHPSTIIEETVNGSSSDYTPMQASTTSMSRSAGELQRRRLSSDADKIDEYEPMEPSAAPTTGTTGATTSTTASRPKLTRQQSWHLDEVRSYISDTTDSSATSSSVGLMDGSHGSNSAYYVPKVLPMAPSLLSRITNAWSGVGSSTNDRQRAHSFGSWKKHSTTMVPNNSCINKDEHNFRQRSESFGSGRPQNSMTRFLDRFNSKHSSHSDDLVEMDFGPSPSIGCSLSGSLSSNESLFRSRTNSINNTNGRPSWSPKVEQITEQDARTPSAKLIEKFLSDHKLIGGTANNTVPTSDYVPMGGGCCSKTYDANSNAAPPKCSCAGDEYVIMNCRRSQQPSDDRENLNVRPSGQLELPYLETSSGYSSTGDCSEIGQQNYHHKTFGGGTVEEKLSSTKVLDGVQPTKRFSDVRDDEAIVRRFAKVDVNASPRTAAGRITTGLFNNFDRKQLDYENINWFGDGCGESTTKNGKIIPTKIIGDVLMMNQTTVRNNSSKLLVDDRSPSSLSSGTTPTPSPYGSVCNVPSGSNTSVTVSSCSSTLTARQPTTCGSTSPKHNLLTGGSIASAHETGDCDGDMTFTQVDLAKVEPLKEVVAS